MAKADRRLFRPFDLVLPILPALLAFGGCVYAAIVAQEPSKIWVSLATGCVFLLAIPGWYWARYAFTEATYVTKHEVYVVWGKINRPKKEDVEDWTEKLIDLWSTESLQKPEEPVVIKREDVEEAIKNIRVFFNDKKIIGRLYRTIRGIKKEIAFAGIAIDSIRLIVSYWPDVPQHGVPGIYRHELSHPILSLNGYSPGDNYGDNHHKIFHRVGLSAPLVTRTF
jgi:hypothetical protein